MCFLSLFPFPDPILQRLSGSGLIFASWIITCYISDNSYSHRILASHPRTDTDPRGLLAQNLLKSLKALLFPPAQPFHSQSSRQVIGQIRKKKKKTFHAWNVGEMRDKSCSSKVKYFKIAEQCHGLQVLTKDINWYSWRDMQQAER